MFAPLGKFTVCMFNLSARAEKLPKLEKDVAEYKKWSKWHNTVKKELKKEVKSLKIAKSQIKKQLLSLAGEFAVASKLCLQDKVASLTLKNYPEIDIFVHDPITQRDTSIQVKTIRQRRKKKWKNDSFPLGKDLSKVKINYPFVFVYIQTDRRMRFFIVPPEDVVRLAKEHHEHFLKYSKHRKPVEMFEEVWDVIDVGRLLPFEDRWDNI